MTGFHIIQKIFKLKDQEKDITKEINKIWDLIEWSKKERNKICIEPVEKLLENDFLMAPNYLSQEEEERILNLLGQLLLYKSEQKYLKTLKKKRVKK